VCWKNLGFDMSGAALVTPDRIGRGTKTDPLKRALRPCRITWTRLAPRLRPQNIISTTSDCGGDVILPPRTTQNGRFTVWFSVPVHMLSRSGKPCCSRDGTVPQNFTLCCSPADKWRNGMSQKRTVSRSLTADILCLLPERSFTNSLETC
jgi:hypothetical protein